MEGRFLRGVIVGGIAAAALVTKWDALVKQCPFLAEIKGHMLFDEAGQPTRHASKHGAPEQARTRLMARRHRVKKEM